MKKIALCMAMTGLLAACGGHDEPAQGAAAPAPPEAQVEAGKKRAAPAPGKPVPAPEGQRGTDALAGGGVAFEFPHGVLYDILDVSAGGTPRHRVLFEIGEIAFQDAVGRLDRSLRGLGYTLASDKQAGGRIDRVYTAEGKPTYYLIMQPAGMGPKLRGKASSGSIHIMWNLSKGAS